MGAWLEERAGLSRIRGLLMSRCTVGAGRSLALGSSIVTLLLLQIATGSLLALYYKPTWQGAHASVEKIVTAIPAGWLMRALHSWGAHLTLLLALVHLVRAAARGAAAKPRELAWMAAVMLAAVLGGIAITGQMLPMDNEAVGGANVAASLAGTIPGAGTLVRGGDSVGEPMLGRFFVAHAMWLPGMMLVVLVAHAFQTAKHGIAAGGGDGATVLECVAIPALGSVALVATLATLWPPGLERAYDPGVNMPEGLRPLWPFLPAYQLLHLGVPEIIVALLAPVVVALTACLPLGGRPLRIALALLVHVLVALGIWGALAHRAIGA